MGKQLDIIGVSRREILSKLISENYKNLNDFCNQTGEEYSAIYRYIHNNVKIGDKVISRFEKIFNKPAGFFDQQLPKLTAINIPIVDSVVKGNVKLSDMIANSNQYTLLDKKMLDEYDWNKDSLFAIIAKDDSMHPLIRDKSEVVIDSTQTEIENNKIYAVKINSDIYIRKLIKSPVTGLITFLQLAARFISSL